MSVDRTQRERGEFIPRQYSIQFGLVTMLFLLWGIPNNLNDILIAQFMKSFELNRFQAGLIQSAYYMGYFLLAIPAGLFMTRYSYKSGLVSGLFLFAVGCCLFYPAALAGEYAYFLFALFVIATGLTFMETGANIFIAKLGSQHTAERRLNFSQAFNPVGAILGVLIGTLFIFSGIEYDARTVDNMKRTGSYQAYLNQETMRVVIPYLVLGAFGLLWAIIIMFHRFPMVSDQKKRGERPTENMRELVKKPYFCRGVLSQFFYCGAQTCTWSFFIPYVQQYAGHPEKIAGYFLTGTLAAFGAGRFSASYFMRFLEPAKLMGLYSAINVVLVLVAMLLPGTVGVWTIFMTSFFMSPMYPTNFVLSVRGLGANTKIGGSILVMATVGGAIFPPLVGLLVEGSGKVAFGLIIPLMSYIYIAYYAFAGSAIVEKGSISGKFKKPAEKL